MALLFYGRALQLQPNDISILNAAKRVAALSKHENLCKCLSSLTLNSTMIEMYLDDNDVLTSYTQFEPIKNVRLIDVIRIMCHSLFKNTIIAPFQPVIH